MVVRQGSTVATHMESNIEPIVGSGEDTLEEVATQEATNPKEITVQTAELFFRDYSELGQTIADIFNSAFSAQDNLVMISL